ncbi:MAG: hypothetical protein JW717_02645 [Marinilabiliaceae bacterium]|nr:hypothetical protein [Marinilabiliaceae bacterium]
MKNSTKILQSNNKLLLSLVVLLIVLVMPVIIHSAPKVKPVPPPVSIGQDGKLVYRIDSLGDRIPDYSYCGYLASESQIPFVLVKVVVYPIEGDATTIIQKAIDYVSGLPFDDKGFKGVILLKPGIYKVNGRFNITKSGVVIRGSGWQNNPSVIIADGLSRETLFRIEGGKPEVDKQLINITNNYVPVNSTSFNVEDAKLLKTGMTVFITRPSTKEWIDKLDMKVFGGETDWLGWKPGERNIVWDRTIISIEGNKITIDAPLTTALDKQFGGGTLQTYQWNTRVFHVGIENIQLQSSFNSENIKDEEHCWNAISFENARDCWVRQVTFKNFAGSAVASYESTSRITVEDCISKEPVSEIGGMRRYTFFTSGQQNLFQRIYAEFGYHDFSTGFCAAGPNAFVQCESHLPYSFSGAIDSWVSGVLFDIVNVDGNALSFRNRMYEVHGAGWTAANSMFWQCSASLIQCYEPPTANNWAFGAWAQFEGNGYWYEPNSHVKPRSLFYAQLADRIEKDKIPQNSVMFVESEATSSPTVEMAAEIVAGFSKPNPVPTLIDFINEAPQRIPIDITHNGVPDVSKIKLKYVSVIGKTIEKTAIKNGWLVKDGVVITGLRRGVPWWSLNLKPRGLARASMAITRFVPGRIGKGYTDDLNEVISEMNQNNIVGIEQNYALWYDRRRDDHERIRRMNGEVWAPFYELPFSRSGKELAWDGLSKYDLTKYNNWYWNRLKEFADLSDRNGKVLIHQNYFQHNILEAGAHWVDSPWRSVNNINSTDFPEPPPFAGDKRIFIADRFYDISHPVRRELHRKYIRQCLDNFKDNISVIQTTSEEYTGPFEFVQFWLDVIDEWEKENGKNVLIALSTTKDVQDAILSDPVRSKVVDIIDIRYWSSRPDGTIYAPKGGVNLAPRQHARQIKPGKRSIEQVYTDVWIYRKNYPSKAVIYSESQYRGLEWGVFMASGSLAPIPKVEADGFLDNASTMQVDEKASEKHWTLKNEKGDCIVYCKDVNELSVPVLGISGNYQVTAIHPHDGTTAFGNEKFNTQKQSRIDLKGKGELVVWFKKK